MNKTTFSTTNITTAAALLATGKVSLVGFKNQGDRKAMLLSPRMKARSLFGEFNNDQLMINASKNDYWVNQLKNVIFGNLPAEKVIERNGEKNEEKEKY